TSNPTIKKRISLTGAQKKELCKKKHDNPNLKGVELAKVYEISEQSVSDILKCSEYWLDLDDAFALTQTKCQRKSNYPNLEEALLAQCNIILLLNNALSHNSENIQNLSNVHIHFLSLNTTFRLQPIDQGIAYDAITKDNPTPSELTIYNAINFSAQAWENVTANTIIHSWSRANILPTTEIFDDNFIFTSEETELEIEIINLIEHLLISDPSDVQEYINIDNYIDIEESLTVNDIVDIVNRQGERESEKEEQDKEIVKISDAIVELDNLI
ncbi:15102_t:CDS:2, partial [Cetraspora pellucida]